ncbi:blue copper protein-like [Argentina anserina]|uniref:blue copper protein-like n=1 Tax=Argentina anserina TaxID=57926 RepID=UPI0021764A96|nr:blue copper protein-like [Potentilla anserina]
MHAGPALIAVFVVFPSIILAEQYVVGNDLGWDGGPDYQAWADGITFLAGDVIVELLGHLGTYTSGYDALVLAVPQTYYFLCDWHCGGSSQKFMITVN